MRSLFLPFSLSVSRRPSRLAPAPPLPSSRRLAVRRRLFNENDDGSVAGRAFPPGVTFPSTEINACAEVRVPARALRRPVPRIVRENRPREIPLSLCAGPWQFFQRRASSLLNHDRFLLHAAVSHKKATASVVCYHLRFSEYRSSDPEILPRRLQYYRYAVIVPCLWMGCLIGLKGDFGDAAGQTENS